MPQVRRSAHQHRLAPAAAALAPGLTPNSLPRRRSFADSLEFVGNWPWDAGLIGLAMRAHSRRAGPFGAGRRLLRHVLGEVHRIVRDPV